MFFLFYFFFARCDCDPVDFVDPFIGTGGIGFGVGSTPPGAQVPFGVARVSPDTCTANDWGVQQLHFGGYYYPDTFVRGISHMHTQGAGAVDLGVVGVMPFLHDPASIDYRVESWRLSLDKSSEVATPGYYSASLGVGLADDVQIELTATQWAGHHRYTFNDGVPAALLILPAMTILGDNGHLNASIELDAASGSASGFVQVAEALSSRSSTGYLTVYYFVQFDASTVAASGVWENLRFGRRVANATRGNSCGAFLQFSASTSVIEFVVGVSLVSAAQAQRNAAPIMGQSFDATASAARQLWVRQLAVFDAQGSADTKLWRDRLTMFFTAAFHAFCAPSNYTELSAEYRGMDNRVHSVPEGETYLSDLSIWDIFRTQAPLLNFVLPNTIAAPLMRSFERMVRDGGALPRWALGPVYAGSMVGNHANAIIADTFFRANVTAQFNASFLFEAMWDAVRNPNAPHAARPAAALKAWLSLGYLPENAGVGSTAAVALDWALDDAMTARVAAALGATAKAANLTATAQNFRRHWDNSSQLFCRRAVGGALQCPDALESYNVFDKHYIEDDAQVYAFYVLHDVPALIELNGGNDSFVARFEAFAEATFDDTFNGVPNPCVWVGNEPALLIPWLAHYAGRADLGQAFTHKLVSTFFSTSPAGIAGNDDYGTLSSWLLFAMAGLQPVVGTALFFVGAPMLATLEFRLDTGVSLRVTTENLTPASHVTLNVTLNGAAVDMRRHAFVSMAQLTARRRNSLHFVF